MKRRDFLAALSAGTLARAGSVEPELVLWNGNIHTMDTANPHAEAVALATSVGLPHHNEPWMPPRRLS